MKKPGDWSVTIPSNTFFPYPGNQPDGTSDHIKLHLKSGTATTWSLFTRPNRLFFPEQVEDAAAVKAVNQGQRFKERFNHFQYFGQKLRTEIRDDAEIFFGCLP